MSLGEKKERRFTYTNKSPRDWELSAIKNDANKNLRTKSPSENTEILKPGIYKGKLFYMAYALTFVL